jgi:ribosomal protein L11 methylase PrmA
MKHTYDDSAFVRNGYLELWIWSCGTAILAILAEMKGAQPIDLIDIDNWCYLNSIENAERNNCKHITVYEEMQLFLKDQKIRFNYMKYQSKYIVE